jgi:hypothetical protein
MRRATGGHPTHRPTAARGRRALAAALAAGALLPVSASAAEGKPPKIESVGTGVGGEVTVNAQINPEGLETTWEIKLACAVCGPPGYTPAVGQLSAVNETRTVSLNLTGIQPGTYSFDVHASNTAGEAFTQSELTVPATPPGACPNGCGTGEEYRAEIPAWSSNLAEGESAQTIKEYEAKQAKEREEQQAKEAAIRAAEATALKQHEEREAAERTEEQAEEAQEAAPPCVVPSLRGYTLAAARHALTKHHCRPGKITRPAHHHGTLYVTAQGAPAGKRLRRGGRVALVLGAKQASHR